MLKTGAAPSKAADDLKANEKKWTKPVMAAGWSAVPNILIEKQAALGLDPIHVNIILHLMQYWWQAENLPHPSVKTIAAAISVTPRTVQKRIAQLEAFGLMERTERRESKYGSQTNLYSFKGLIKALTPHAIEKAKEIEEAKAAKSARIARKKPTASHLKVVVSTT